MAAGYRDNTGIVLCVRVWFGESTHTWITPSVLCACVVLKHAHMGNCVCVCVCKIKEHAHTDESSVVCEVCLKHTQLVKQGTRTHG